MSLERKPTVWELVIWTTVLVALATSMYILIVFTALSLSLQPYYWLSIIAITSPLISFVLYIIRKWGKIREELPGHLEFAYKGAPISGFLGFINLILVGYSSSPQRSPPDFQAIASQLTVPTTVVASIILIRRFPSRLQTLAALLVIGGVVVSIVPSLENVAFAGQPFWMVCFVIGNAVQGPQATLMEHSMKSKWTRNKVIDGFCATAIVGVWSGVFFFAALPLNFWPWFSQSDEGQFWRLMKGANDCTLHNTDPANPSAPCNLLWLILLLLVLVVTFWNAVSAEMEARITANYTQIANSMGGVLATFFFNIKVLAGGVYEPFSWFNVLAVILIVLGTVGYQYFEKDTDKYEQIDHQKTMLDFLMITKIKSQHDNLCN